MRTVLERLIGHSPNGELEPFDLHQVQCAITDLVKKKWTDDEIVSHLKWLEHVNPLVDEDVAIRNMRRVKEQVKARLRSENVAI